MDLRTRIVAALRNMTGDLTYEAMADAVIRTVSNYRREASEDVFVDELLLSDDERTSIIHGHLCRYCGEQQ